MAKEKKINDFNESEKSILNLPSGDLRIHTSSDFASTINAQQEEMKNNAVETPAENILTPSNEAIDTTSKAIATTAINHFFKIFYDSYMASDNSDLKYRLGKTLSAVPRKLKVQTTSNFKSSFEVQTGYGKVGVPNQFFINHFFPPYQPLNVEEQESSKVYRKWDDAHNKWEIVSNNTEGAVTNYDLKNLLLESDDFTYRGSGFKSINDNIFQVQRILEHVTGVVSTYLTDWDISLYLQEGILDKSTDGKANIGLLYRILQDNPSRYSDIRALSWGVLNAAVSKISAVSGIINAPKAHINPSYFPFSSNWTEYDSFNRGDGLDIFYDIATTDLTKDETIKTSHIKLNSYSNLDILGKSYSSLGYKEKLYFWDCKGAAYSGWKNWSNLRYYNAVYTTPEDSLSDIDMVHTSETEGRFGWIQTQTENSIIQRVVQALYNNDDTLGFEINEWKIKRNMEQSTNPSDPSYRYDYYIRNPITGGPSFVAAATYRSDNKIIDWYDENGKVLDTIENEGVLKKFEPYSGLLLHPKAARYFLSRTCKYWPEIKSDFGNKCPCENDTVLNIEENQSNNVSTTEKSGSNNSSSSLASVAKLGSDNLGDDVCSSGVPRWNPFFYGGPHGRDKSPFIISSMFDENSKVLRNVPRIEPKYSDEEENIGVEKFYNYNTDEFVTPLGIQNFGAVRSPSSNLKKLIKGDITSELKKSEEYITYRELLPWIEKSRTVKCKTEYYWGPKYEKLGNSYDKRGADTIAYENTEMVYGDIVEHTGFFSPDSIPSKEQYPTYKSYGKGSWYSTMAYEWANYFQYAANSITYYKGNTIQSELKYPYTPNPADGSTIAKTYGANSPTATGGNYNSSVAQGVPGAAYGGPNPGGNWEMRTGRGTFYELLCTYKAYGKYGTWHRWEIRYVNTPIMYADLAAYWQIDEFTEYEYTTSVDKKAKIGNAVLGVFTGGISNLFTTKQVNASVVAGSGKKRYRLVLGAGRTAEQLTTKDSSFSFQSEAEKKLEQVLMGDIKDNTGKNWKKCFFFVAPSEQDMKVRGPEAIFSMYLKKSKMKAVVTETSKNAVGCNSASGRTTDRIVDYDYIEIYNYKKDDEGYDKTLKPEIYTGFNPNYMNGKEIFNPSKINFEDLASITPTTERNAQRFLNNIFAAHTNESGVCSDAEQILYLLGEDEANLGEEEADEENEQIEYDKDGKEIGRKRYLYRVIKNKEPQKTYGWGFTTYFPGIGGDGTGVDSVPEKFKKKLNLRYRSDLAHPNQRDFVYQWWPKQLAKKLRYRLSNSKPEKEEIRDENGVLIETRYWNTYVDSNERRNHCGNPNEPLAVTRRVLKDSAEENEVKNMKAFPDKAERDRLGIEKGNWYFNNWIKEPYDRPLSWFFEPTTDDGYYETWKDERMTPENFGASMDFWCADDVYGNSFTRANGYYLFGRIFQVVFKYFFTTSTFFLENTKATDGVNNHYEDVTSPCVIDSSVPFGILYGCVCQNLVWAKESKNYIMGVLGSDNKLGANFKNVIKMILNKRILNDSGITGTENKNSLYYNPWVKFIYDNCSNVTTLYENFDSMIRTLENCKKALNCIDYNTSFQSLTINQLKNLRKNAASVQAEAYSIERNEIPKIFEYIYSYLNVLYEYRKFFIFKRCNKQSGTLFQARNFECALPLIEQNMNDKMSADTPDWRPVDSNIHCYDIAMAMTQNTNTMKAEAAADDSITLEEDKWAVIYIPVVKVENDNPDLLEYIKYFNDNNGEIPSNMQRYIYIKKVDRWVEVPFNDNYVLESTEYTKALSTIAKNNIILKDNDNDRVEVKKDLIDLDEGYLLKDENGKVVTPLQPDAYVQNIDWIDTSKVDYLDNIIQSVKFTGPDDPARKAYHYKVPYYEYNSGATNYPFIYFGITDGVDIDKFLEYQKNGSSELDTFCAARVANDYWQVTLTSKLPYKRLHKTNLKIKTYLKSDDESLNPDLPSFLSGPFSSQIWPIYSHQAADVPSLQDELLEVN